MPSFYVTSIAIANLLSVPDWESAPSAARQLAPQDHSDRIAFPADQPWGSYGLVLGSRFEQIMVSAFTLICRVPVHLPALLPQLAPSFHALQLSAGLSSAANAGRLAPGEVFTKTKTFTPAEVASFLQLSGDSNPIHGQAEAARAAGLPGPILPGMLSASLFPAIIGSCFPGAVYLSQTLRFKSYALVSTLTTALVNSFAAFLARQPKAAVCGDDQAAVSACFVFLRLIP